MFKLEETADRNSKSLSWPGARAFVVLLGLSVAGCAQTTYATITGIVTDSTGAVISKATVTATNQETRTPSTTASNAAGAYTVPRLGEGTYTLKVEAAGFREYMVQNIRLVSREVRRVDVALEAGNTTAASEASAGGVALIQTEARSVLGPIGLKANRSH